MPTVITSEELHRDASATLQAAETSPVIITEDGRRTHVLLTAEEYDRLARAHELLGDKRWRRGTEDEDLELPQRVLEEPRELGR